MKMEQSIGEFTENFQLIIFVVKRLEQKCLVYQTRMIIEVGSQNNSTLR